MQKLRIEVPKTLLAVARLARLLEALERSGGRVDAGQYRLLVQRLQQALGDVAGHAGLGALLDHFPAAAQVYENLQYECAGLCRSQLDLAVATEGAARALLKRVRAS
jgi:hypothetical protein